MILDVFVLWNILLIANVNSLSISPRLDFGDPRKSSRSSRQSSVAQDLEGIGTVCISGDCSSTKTNTNNGTLSADVTVHVTAKIDVKNDSKDQGEVPVVIGNRASPQNELLVPTPPPVYVIPSTTESRFLPSRRGSGAPVFVGTQVKGLSDYERHIQGFGNFGNGFMRPHFYAAERQGFGHRNPVEFTKTYPAFNSVGWTPMVWTGRSPQINHYVPGAISPPTHINHYVPGAISPPTHINHYVPGAISPPTQMNHYVPGAINPPTQINHYVPSTLNPPNCVCQSPGTYPGVPSGRSYYPSNVHTPGISDKVASLN